MNEEKRKKIDKDLKKELLDKVEQDGYHDTDKIKKKLEGKIPTKPKDKKK